MSDSGGELGESLETLVEELDGASTALGDKGSGPSPDAIEGLADLVGDATVVGLGETGHGIHEMYSYRARLCRILIEELGYRHIALEADFAGACAIDRYVIGDGGTAEDALQSPGVHRIWQNEPTAAFLEWARSFNEGRPADDRIRFHGLDITDGGPIGEALRAHLETVDPSLLETVADDLQLVIETSSPFGIGSTEREEELTALADACERLAGTLQAHFESNRQSYRNASETVIKRAEREASLIGTLGEMAAAYDEEPPTTAIEARNRTLAEGVSWLLDSGTADRVVFLAHNLHVKRGTWRGPLEDATAAGEFLHQQFGDGYRRIGGSVATGHVRVYDDETGTPETVEIPPPQTHSLPSVLSRGEHEHALVDLGGVPDEGPTTSWLGDEPVLRELATRIEQEVAQPFETNPRAMFDGLLFVQEATAANGIGE